MHVGGDAFLFVLGAALLVFVPPIICLKINCDCFEKGRAAYAFRSAPAQKVRPAPVTMTTLDIPELGEVMEME